MKRFSRTPWTAGDLRENIEFKNLTTAADGSGGFTETWSLLSKSRAYIEKVKGLETIESDQVQATGLHLIVCRYFVSDPVIDEKVIIYWGDVKFEIISVDNLQKRNQWFEILAIEKV